MNNPSKHIENINDLPDDCLILILKRCYLPLQLLITLRAVCKRWQSVIIESICHRKRNLKLFGSIESDLITYCNFLIEYNLEENEDFCLKPIGKDDDLVIRSDCDHNYLVDLFPNVENLVVYLTRFSSQMFNMPFLLNNLSNLTSLTLIYMPYPIDLQNQVWSAINLMKTLKKLSLFYIFQCKILDDMPVLKRLDNFLLDGYYGDIVSVLQQLGPQLKHLHLGDVHCSIEQLQQVQKENPLLMINLTQFTIGSVNTVKPILNNLKKNQFVDFICANLKSLSILAFTPYSAYALDEIIISLDLLSSLTELHLPNSWIGCPVNLSNLQKCTTQLKFVKRLNLTFNVATDSSQNEFPQIDFFTIFPNLDEMTIFGNQNLLTDAEQHLLHYNKNGLCKINFRLKNDDIVKHIGRHSERYQRYLQLLELYNCADSLDTEPDQTE